MVQQHDSNKRRSTAKHNRVKTSRQPCSKSIERFFYCKGNLKHNSIALRKSLNRRPLPTAQAPIRSRWKLPKIGSKCLQQPTQKCGRCKNSKGKAQKSSKDKKQHKIRVALFCKECAGNQTVTDAWFALFFLTQQTHSAQHSHRPPHTICCGASRVVTLKRACDRAGKRMKVRQEQASLLVKRVAQCEPLK